MSGKRVMDVAQHAVVLGLIGFSGAMVYTTMNQAGFLIKRRADGFPPETIAHQLPPAAAGGASGTPPAAGSKPSAGS